MLCDKVAVRGWIVVSKRFSANLNDFRLLNNCYILGNRDRLNLMNNFWLLRLNFFDHSILLLDLDILNLRRNLDIFNQIYHLVLVIILAHINHITQN